MGNFSINIQGVGPYDTEEFRQSIYGLMQHLSRLGNSIDSAILTFGGRQDFLRNAVTRESIETTAVETTPCCNRDYDQDGNCNIHPAKCCCDTSNDTSVCQVHSATGVYPIVSTMRSGDIL